MSARPSVACTAFVVTVSCSRCVPEQAAASTRKRHGRVRFMTGSGAIIPLFLLLVAVAPAAAQAPAPPTRADILRGEYGRYRANNDLLSYHLDIRVDPDRKWIGGKNTIRFRMLQDDTRIQLDLYANLAIDRIVLGTVPLKYTREITPCGSTFPRRCETAAPTRSSSTTRASPRRLAALVACRSRRIPRAGTGCSRRLKTTALPSGGPTRI